MSNRTNRPAAAPIMSHGEPQTQDLVADLERAERRADDPRFSSKLRGEAVQRAARIRREIDRIERAR
jgi:hypothetical protein